jgi:hypothetical protein
MNCTAPNCTNKIKAKGFCDKHYQRFLQYGGKLKGTDKPVFSSIEERFLYYVNKTDTCWIWLGKSFTKFGYGRFNFGKRKIEHAHRSSFKLFKGTIPKGAMILHKCDNPKCVNPEHLFLGTAYDNAQDMINKRRHSPGRKYSFEIIKSIRRDYSKGQNLTFLHNKYKVSLRHLRDIINNKWRKNE